MVVQEFKGRVAGFKVKAVDTTGAGDAFVGGILIILASNPNLYKVHSVILLLLSDICLYLNPSS